MAYEFSNLHYIAAHGKDPRGKGWWMFEDNQRNIIADIQGLHTLTEAKKLAAKELKENGFPEYRTVYVAP